MTTDTTEVAAVTDPGPAEFVPVPAHEDTIGEQIEDAIMAIPAALIAAGNSATIAGATAFAAAGPAGLAGAGVVAGVGAAGAAVARRAHRREAERRAAAKDGKAPVKPVKAPRAPRPPRIPRARTAARTAAARQGVFRARPGARAGGGVGRPSAGRGGAKTIGSRSGGLPSAGRHGAGKVGAGKATRAAAGGRSAGHRAAGAGRPAGLLGRGTGMARPGGGRGAGAGGRVGTGRPGSRLGALAGGRRGASGSRLGKGTHAVAGSRPGRAATAAGRRVAGVGRRAAAGISRANTTGRAALGGAAGARKLGPRAAAKAARAAVRREHARRDAATGARPGRLVRARRFATRAAAGAGVFSFAAGRDGGGFLGRWLLWLGRAVAAKAAGAPIPAPPGQGPTPEQTAAAASGHPPVGDRVIEGTPQTRGVVTVSTSQGSTLGLMLTDLAGQMSAAATGYDPESMTQWGADIQALGPILGHIGGMIRAFEQGAGDLPVEPAVVGAISTVAGLLEAASSAAEEIYSTFRTVHKDDLDRLENPRTNEEKWDAGVNK